MNKSYSDQINTYSVTSNKSYLILFLLWPFLAFLTAIWNYNNKNAKKVVYIFLIYYGLTFVVGSAGNDAERYAMFLAKNAELPFSDFFKIVGGLYNSDTSVDIIEPLISFIISRFTNRHNFLFAAYAAIFGFFYLKSINLLYDRYNEKPGVNSLIYMWFFIMTLPVTAINGFRMWTAAWIFFYAAYHVILYHDKKYLILALASSFVHWSFLSANAILMIYYFAGNRNFIYVPLAITSFIIPQFLSPLFQALSLRLGGGLQNRYEMYSNENFAIGMQQMNENAAWFLTLSEVLVLYFILAAIVIIKVWNDSLMKDKSEKNLFSFLLLFLTFVNFGRSIPSFGDRFQIIFFLFAVFYIFLYSIKLPGNKFILLTWIGLFPMLLRSLVIFRQSSESINAWIITPIMGLPLFDSATSLYDILFR